MKALAMLASLSLFLAMSPAGLAGDSTAHLPAREITVDRQAEKNVQATAEKLLAPLGGHTAFLFTELTDRGPVPLDALREDEVFAIGSSFKLFILGTLADEVNDGRRRMDNTMKLQAALIGPPHSELAEWPLGSPVTLHTLALKMISISDNTATDHLLYLLGRENIERQMTIMGNKHAALDRPLLYTREMTLLRDKAAGLPGKAYQKLDEAAKRKFLAEHCAGPADYEKLDFDAAGYKLAEWYAAPLDMARALDWIYRHTGQDDPAHDVRGILAVKPMLKVDAKQWPYVGFKGGSEDQLLAGNWLLQNRNGRWYTYHVYYNQPDGTADQQKMIEAMQQIFDAIGQSLAAR